MLVNFDDLNGDASVWIYQSSKAFSESEIAHIKAKLNDFIKDWKRHGNDLMASYSIKYNHFIVLAVDETQQEVSGCSLDASMKFIKQLEQELQTDLTNRLNISFKDNANINIVSLADFQKYAKQKKITENTIVFNNLVNTKDQFESNWEVTADKSWHKKYLAI